MRRVLVAASVAAIFGLSACGEAKEEAAAPPPPPKSMARPQQMYAGQEQVAKVDSATLDAKTAPGTLNMTAEGSVGSAGYKNAGFLPRINAAPPKDGVYEVDVVADRPAGAAASVVTPITVKGGWTGYPSSHLKGVKFIAKTNSVVVMLPAG